MEGELLLAEDKIDLAIEKFRHVHRTQPTPISGARLLNAFCIALKDSYPQYRDARPEIGVAVANRRTAERILVSVHPW